MPIDLPHPRAFWALGILVMTHSLLAFEVDPPSEGSIKKGFITDFFKRFPQLPFSEDNPRGGFASHIDSTKSPLDKFTHGSSSYTKPSLTIKPSPKMRLELTVPMKSRDNGNSDIYMEQITQPMVFQPHRPNHDAALDDHQATFVHHQSLKTNNVNTGFVISSPFTSTNFGDGKDDQRPFQALEYKHRSTTTPSPQVPIYVPSTPASASVVPQESRDIGSSPLYREAPYDSQGGLDIYGTKGPRISVNNLKTLDPYSAKEEEHRAMLEEAEQAILTGKRPSESSFGPSPTPEEQRGPNYFQSNPNYGPNDSPSGDASGDYESSAPGPEGNGFSNFQFGDQRPNQQPQESGGDFANEHLDYLPDDGEKPFGVGVPDFMDYEDDADGGQAGKRPRNSPTPAQHLFGEVFPEFSANGPSSSDGERPNYEDDYSGDEDYQTADQGSDYPLPPAFKAHKRFPGRFRIPHPTSIAAIVRGANQFPSGFPGPSPTTDLVYVGPRHPEGGNNQEPEDDEVDLANPPPTYSGDGDFPEPGQDQGGDDYDYDSAQIGPRPNHGGRFKLKRFPLQGRFRKFPPRNGAFQPHKFGRNNPGGGNGYGPPGALPSRPLYRLPPGVLSNIRPNPDYPGPRPGIPLEDLPAAIKQQLGIGGPDYQDDEEQYPNSGPGSDGPSSPSNDYGPNGFETGPSAPKGFNTPSGSPYPAEEQGFPTGPPGPNEFDPPQGPSGPKGYGPPQGPSGPNGYGPPQGPSGPDNYGAPKFLVPGFDQSLLDDPKFFEKPNLAAGPPSQFGGQPPRVRGRPRRFRNPAVLRQANLRLRQRLRTQLQGPLQFNDYDGDVYDNPDLPPSGPSIVPQFRSFDEEGGSGPELDEPDYPNFNPGEPPNPAHSGLQGREAVVPRFPVPNRPNFLTHWIAGTPTHVLVKEGRQHKLKKIKWKKLPPLNPPRSHFNSHLPAGIQLAGPPAQK